ncbi:MAG: cobalamin biosynthesis bifunctional protein CbiET [Rhodospirillaceae bacterium]|nr:cobalamin biosynthesis bifunctional protein CbiET [Rhodospirillaceae bacterium]
MRPLVAGVTEAGIAALPDRVLQRIATASCIIAATRFHDALPETAEIIDWPKPFSNIFSIIDDKADKSLVILTTGDPMWFGAGASLASRLGPDGCEVVPAVSGLQLAAAHLGWPMQDCRIVSIHGRPLEHLRAALFPNGRLLVIAQDGNSPAAVAKALCAWGHNKAQIYVMAYLGGTQEAFFSGTAADWQHNDVPDFHIIGIACDGATPANGLAAPDDHFVNDGKLTKRDARASALVKLAPFPKAVLWDIGSGSGAVSVDFLRAAPGGRAIGIDRNQDQLDMALANAERHGVAGFTPVKADLAEDPAALFDSLPTPDAVFVGGGLSADILALAKARLRPGGVLVAHAVTIESEALMVSAWQGTGGDLTRITVQHADPVGGFHGWRPLMPITQWVWLKPSGGGTGQVGRTP